MNMITRIEKMLNEQGIKRSTMLADLDIPSSTFSTWKKKGSDPDLKSVIKLANYLGVSMDYILNGETGNIQKIELDDEPIQIRVMGKVAAGIPIEAVEDVIGEETISKKMAETGDYFGLRISGDSMEPLIHHGSIVIVRQQDDVENGDIAIVIVNGEDATCKKIEKFENGIMLVPINKAYKEKFYTNEEIENPHINLVFSMV